MAGHLLATQPPAMPEPAYQDEDEDEDDDTIPNFIEIDLVGGTQMTHTESTTRRSSQRLERFNRVSSICVHTE